MLALTRKPGESIQIGNDITVHITRIEGNQVRVSIKAPDTVPIMRSELLVGEPPLPEVEYIDADD